MFPYGKSFSFSYKPHKLDIYICVDNIFFSVWASLPLNLGYAVFIEVNTLLVKLLITNDKSFYVSFYIYYTFHASVEINLAPNTKSVSTIDYKIRILSYTVNWTITYKESLQKFLIAAYWWRWLQFKPNQHTVCHCNKSGNLHQFVHITNW